MQDSGTLNAITTFGYDQYNNLTDRVEYAFGGGTAAGSMIRQSHTDYVTDANYTLATGPHLRALPKSQTVKDGSGTIFSQTSYLYDCYAAGDCAGTDSTRVAALLTRTGIVQRDNTAVPTTFRYRGNPTVIQRSVDSSTMLTSYAQFDEAGSPVKAIDARGNATNLTYDSASNTFAYPTSILNALSQETIYSYDFWLGKVKTIKDPNLKTVTYNYSGEPLGRLLSVSDDAGGLVSFTYPTPTQVTATKRINSCGINANAILEQDYDGLGRILNVRRGDPDGDVYIGTSYDAMGRVHSTTNPYRSTDTVANTVTTYDRLGRPVKTAYPDGSFALFQHFNNTAVSRDAGGKWKKTFTDELNRLQQVVEDVTGSIKDGTTTYPNSGSNITTTYIYSPIGSLGVVCQNGTLSGTNCSSAQPARRFGYDWLGRLLSASNPESGTINYTYDENSNLLTKQDGRGTARYQKTVQGALTNMYDKLNRPIYKEYVGVATPAVTYCYDGTVATGDASCGAAAPAITAAIGRLSEVYSSASKMTYSSFDAVGRVLTSTQTTGGTPYTLQYTYDAAGGLEQETYPSPTQRKVKTCRNAAAQITSVQGTLFNYANIDHYAAHGAASQMTLHNNLVEQTCYTNRLQIDKHRVGASAITGCTAQAGDLLHLAFGYTDAIQSGNNGNIVSQTITMPNTANVNTGLVVNQTYQYDRLNRISQVQETIASGGNGLGSGWTTTYGHDEYGNTWMGGTVRGVPVPGAAGDIDITKNRVALGWTYDASGNLTSNSGLGTLAYDGENRMVSGGGQSYVYDGDGRRVMKGSVVYVYDAFGSLVAEYGGSVSATSTQYLVADHLGSTRVVTDASGGVVERHDYEPFGGELGGSAATSNRDLVAGFTSGGVTVKFTGKERDAETGLDYFGARYFSAAQGRFTSPDEPFIDQSESDPQSWNLYGYVRNNPLRFTDPDGRACVKGKDAEGNTCIAITVTGGQGTDAKIKRRAEGAGIDFANGLIGIANTFMRIQPDPRINGRMGIAPTPPPQIPRLEANDPSGDAQFGATVLSIVGAVNLLDRKAWTHILDGDATGGGHRFGTGITGKSEFPAGWNDDKIVHYISDVATDPRSTVSVKGAVTVVTGTREGTDIRVIIRPDNGVPRVVSAYPTNVPKNP